MKATHNSVKSTHNPQSRFSFAHYHREQMTERSRNQMKYHFEKSIHPSLLILFQIPTNNKKNSYHYEKYDNERFRRLPCHLYNVYEDQRKKSFLTSENSIQNSKYWFRVPSCSLAEFHFVIYNNKNECRRRSNERMESISWR